MKQSLLLLCCVLSLSVGAQKKPLDHSVYDSWQSVSAMTLSPKGNVVTYEINPQEGDGRLVIRNNKNGKETVIERGYRARILDNEQIVVCLIKPLFQDTRQAKIKKKKDEDMPKDTLAIVSVRDGKIKKFPEVLGYQLGKHALDAVAFTTSDTTLIPKKERKSKDVGKPMLVYHFASGLTDTIHHVGQYQFDKQGRVLALTVKENKHQSLVAFYQVPSRKITVLNDTAAYSSLPVFNEMGTEALFLQAADTLDSGSKHCGLFQVRIPTTAGDFAKLEPVRLVEPIKPFDSIDTWGLTENSTPRFSDDGSKVFVGMQPYQAAKDTTIVPFETAGLDIWNYDAQELPPMMKANLKKDLKATCLAYYHPQTRRLVPLTTSKYDRISLLDRGNAPFALSVDQTQTVVETQWNIQNEVGVSLVEVTTGRRIPVAKGAFGPVSVSPAGRYVIWYDYRNRCWMLYETQSRQTKNMSEGLGVNFWDEEDDHPMMPESYGIGGWTQNDRDVLLYDRYDIWKVSTADGKAVCLTNGEGRRTQRTYRYVSTKDSSEEPFIRPNETILLNVFDHVTKKNGMATVNVARTATPRLCMLEGYTYGTPVKAKETETYLYTKGNFEHPYDLYLTNSPGKGERQLTHINPQQKEYNWGTAELYHWTAFDGTPLDGILYKPEDFDPAKKYPVMMYFYEKRSESLYSYVTPQPSWSTVNLAFYCSRGYLVFVPDIVYHAGTPGESAYNCVVSAAESLAKLPWVDKENMAIQGQSWGGYQVAYLITRTNLFKAAGAGAPVVNMTSAYGGIRWQTGMSRQFQYEQTQSRIGRDLWNGVELYMENSPLFKLPHVTTPVLIMHNDNDGAVPWYQGIEMFMGLRRLGKPAWLLEYNGEEHNLKERRNRKDLTIRLQQFFDHYLKGEPMPAWMKKGVPTSRKDTYFGFENVE